MEEVSVIYIFQEDRSFGFIIELYCGIDERNVLRRSFIVYTYANIYNFIKLENLNRTCFMFYVKLEYKRFLNDSLNSVSSSDGYGKRG